MRTKNRFYTLLFMLLAALTLAACSGGSSSPAFLSAYNYDDLTQFIKLGEYKGIEIPMQEYNVTDEDIDKELDKRRHEQARLVSVDRPLELAQYLLDHGFNVESVFVDVFTESREVFERLQATAPELKIYQSLGWNIRRMARGHGEGKLVAVGQKSAYFKDTDHFVNIIENDGMYGYRGIRRLMELIREAYRAEKPMRELVQIKGWGCGCA